MDRARHGAACHTVVTVHQIFREAIRSGLGRGELRALTELDLDDVTDFSRRLPAARLFAVWESVMRRIGDPGLPVRAGRNSHLDARSAVYFLAAASDRVGTGIASTVANVSAWTTIYTITPMHRPDGALHLVLEGLDPTRLGARCEAEFQLADIVASVRRAVGDTAIPLRVGFTHPAPPDTSTHRHHFGPGLTFGADHTELVFPHQLLEQPIGTANTGLADVLAGHCAALHAEHPTAPSYALRIRRWLLDQFRTGGPPTVAAAAKALTLSERTLHRRLAAERTTFRELTEATRRDLGIHLVRESPRVLKEIATLTGFSDPRAFHRAYRRWTGTTPAHDRHTRT
jgi:AraC-like DNA-binding protein